MTTLGDMSLNCPATFCQRFARAGRKSGGLGRCPYWCDVAAAVWRHYTSIPTFAYALFSLLLGGCAFVLCVLALRHEGRQLCTLEPTWGPALSWWMWGSLAVAFLNMRLGSVFYVKFRMVLVLEARTQQVPLTQLLEAKDTTPTCRHFLFNDVEIALHCWAWVASIVWNQAGKQFANAGAACDPDGLVTRIYWLGVLFAVGTVANLAYWIGGPLWRGEFLIVDEELAQGPANIVLVPPATEAVCCDVTADKRPAGFEPPTQLGMQTVIAMP